MPYIVKVLIWVTRPLYGLGTRLTNSYMNVELVMTYDLSTVTVKLLIMYKM